MNSYPKVYNEQTLSSPSHIWSWSLSQQQTTNQDSSRWICIHKKGIIDHGGISGKDILIVLSDGHTSTI